MRKKTILTTITTLTIAASAKAAETTKNTGMPSWILYGSIITLILITLLVIIYLILPKKGDVELTPQPTDKILAKLPPKINEEPPEPPELKILNKYIKKQLAKGEPLSQIKERLLSVGWKKDLVRQATDMAKKKYSNMANVNM